MVGGAGCGSAAASVGVRLAGKLTDQWGYQANAGIDRDRSQRHSAYAGTSAIPDLESFALTVDGVSNRTRAFVSGGLSYDLKKNHRLNGSVSIRTPAYSSQTAVSAMGAYQIAF